MNAEFVHYLCERENSVKYASVCVWGSADCLDVAALPASASWPLSFSSFYVVFPLLKTFNSWLNENEMANRK